MDIAAVACTRLTRALSIPLLAVESLVLAPFFAQYTAEGLIFKWLKAA
jgi:hypothetical protein